MRDYIGKRLGRQYLPAQPNACKSKKDAQDAHEAIRPTNVELHPDEIHRYLSEEQFKLYRLIWQRFVASQIVPAVYDQTSVDIEAKADRSYDFRVTGSVLKFDGFLRVYEEVKDTKDEEDDELKNTLPALTDGQKLRLNNTLAEQHFTEPPPRYNEASLVKVLEERGIGRPSTYSSIITTIQDRKYVTKVPPTGRAVRFSRRRLGLLSRICWWQISLISCDTQYTARLEEELDEIEDGTEKSTDLLRGFYGHFEEELLNAEKHVENATGWEKKTDQVCDVCGFPWLWSGASLAPSSPAARTTKRTRAAAILRRRISRTSPT